MKWKNGNDRQANEWNQIFILLLYLLNELLISSSTGKDVSSFLYVN